MLMDGYEKNIKNEPIEYTYLFAGNSRIKFQSHPVNQNRTNYILPLAIHKCFPSFKKFQKVRTTTGDDKHGD